jgi:hypothetical protein
LNIAFGKRSQNLRDVGYFPKINMPARMSADATRQIKLHCLSKCLEVLLKELKVLSFSGKLKPCNLRLEEVSLISGQ